MKKSIKEKCLTQTYGVSLNSLLVNARGHLENRNLQTILFIKEVFSFVNLCGDVW